MIKKLVKASEDYLVLVNSKEYQLLQNKFDTLYIQIKKEQKALCLLMHELKNDRSKFINKNEITCVIPIQTIDKTILPIDIQIKKFDKVFENSISISF